MLIKHQTTPKNKKQLGFFAFMRMLLISQPPSAVLSRGAESAATIRPRGEKRRRGDICALTRIRNSLRKEGQGMFLQSQHQLL